MKSIIVLAAGESKRMKSKTSKVLHPLGGQPLINYVMDSINQLDVHQTIFALSPSLINNPLFSPYTVVCQEKPKGTGHAVQIALQKLKKHTDYVIIICGDTPLLKSSTLKRLCEMKEDIVFISSTINNLEEPYGRVLLDEKGHPKHIIEFKDATNQERLIPIINGGIYKIRLTVLEKFLSYLSPKNEAEEYYLTDLIHLAYNDGFSTNHLPISQEEIQGINTRSDLAKAEEIIQKRLREKFLSQGVTLVDPRSTYFSYDTSIGEDSHIEPFTRFGHSVKIGKNVRINSFCSLEEVTVQDHSIVGPFARLRGDSHLEEYSVVGNFVEVKKSIIGRNSKVKHLSYIGDTTLEESVNIGAGTITCNYDGINKHRTLIKRFASVGANAALVAPLTLGKGCIIGAGSVITKDVEDDSLAFSRTPQKEKKMGASYFKNKRLPKGKD